jgi:hypothetical protein
MPVFFTSLSVVKSCAYELPFSVIPNAVEISNIELLQFQARARGISILRSLS